MTSTPFYEATQDIYISNPEAGVSPACAHRAGDWIPADAVEANGWQDKVRVPAAFAPPQDAAPAAGKERERHGTRSA